LWGNWQQYRQNPLHFLLDTPRTYGDIVRLRFGTTTLYTISHPDMVHDVLAKHVNKFYKDKFQKTMVGRFLGYEGLSMSDGDAWKHQRQLVQPAFHNKRVNSYVQEMVNQIAQMMSDWQDGSIRDIHQDMRKVTLSIVAKALFGADAAIANTLASPAMYAAMGAYIEKTIISPSWLPTPPDRTLREITEVAHRAVRGIIHERRTSEKHKNDLLSILLSAQDEDSMQMTDTQLHDQVLNLLVSGHETTASSLTWTWYLLSQYPDCATRLFEEVDRVLDGRLPTFEDIQHLRYTTMILKEALRLYPPVWLLGREALEEVVVGGYGLKKGSIVIMSPYVLHHDARWFEQPERFLPERFSEENEEKIPQYTYIPFGSGPRGCVGYRFTMVEEALMVAMVAQQYRFSLAAKQNVEVIPLINLHPKDGMLMQLHRREKGAACA